MADLNFLGKSDAVGGETLLQGVRPSISASGIVSAFFSFVSVGFFVGSIILMGGLFLFYRYQSTALSDLQAQQKAIEDDLRPELVNRLVFVDSLLSQVKTLLRSHVYTSNIFVFLENTVHSNAVVGNVTLAVDASKFDVIVTVPSYNVFAEQVRLFESSPFVERISFGSPQIGDRGIAFNVTLAVKPAIFQKSQ